MGSRTMTAAANTGYRPTESKYKGGAHQMYVTYDLDQRTRGAQTAIYPKVKRVYIAGDVKGWNAGAVRKRTGREVHGVRIEYEQTRQRYRRKAYAAQRGKTDYRVAGVGRVDRPALRPGRRGAGAGTQCTFLSGARRVAGQI